MIVTLLIADIVAEHPFAVRAPEQAQAVDQPIARDADGNVFVPASSLAGSLRAHLRRLALDVALLGPTIPDGHEDDDTALTSSPLRLLGTTATLGGLPVGREQTSTRGQSRINRRRGAAEPNSLRHATTAAAGTRVQLFLRYDGTLDEQSMAALRSWVPTIGGGRTSGLGRARLDALRWGILDLARPDDLRTWLTRSGPELMDTVATWSERPSAAPLAPLLSVRLRIVDGLLVGGQRDGSTTKIHRRDGQPAIEGSSLKGVLRSRAEYILRSVGVEACESSASACGTCRCCLVFGSPTRRGVVAVRGAVVHGAVEACRPHVAIDRVTGGARPHLLYADEVLLAGEFDLIIDRLGEIEPWMEVLLRWVLRDLHDGLVGIGSRTTRGLGTVEIVDPSLTENLPPTGYLAQETTE